MRNYTTLLPVAVIGLILFAGVNNASAAEGSGCGHCNMAAACDSKAVTTTTAPPAVAKKQGEVRAYSYEPSYAAPTYRTRSNNSSGGFDALAPLRLKGVIR